MKILIYLYHLFVSSLLVSIFIFLIFEGLTKFIILGVWFVLFSALYLYLDKLILYLLGAREIIDSDNQTLFQYIKSASYQNFETDPKVYIYSGFGFKCFVLSSRKDWSIVLDRKLMDKLSSEQIKYLINYLVLFKKSKIPWRQTKSMGLNSFFVLVIYNFLTKVLLINTKSSTFKILSFFWFILLKPLFELNVWPARKVSKIDSHYSLESIVNLNKEVLEPLSFSTYAFSHIQNEINTNEMIIKLIESIPVIENSKTREVI